MMDLQLQPKPAASLISDKLTPSSSRYFQSIDSSWTPLYDSIHLSIQKLLHLRDMFHAIWEFAQSRDCIVYSRNPKIAQAISGLHNMRAQPRDRIMHMRNLKIT